MFSALDLLMQQSPGSIIGKLPLSDPVKDAIIRHSGAMGGALSCVLAVENAQWSATGFEKLYQMTSWMRTRRLFGGWIALSQAFKPSF